MKALTEVRKQLIECLRAYIANEEPKELITRDESFDEKQYGLFRLAYEQKLIPIVYASGYSRGENTEFSHKLKRSAVEGSLIQTLATLNFTELYRRFNEENVSPIVVKGIVARSLYREESVRPSGDEDIYAETEEKFLRCREIMISEGGRAEDGGDEAAAVIAFFFPNGLHIELHRKLFDDTAFEKNNGCFAHAETQLLRLGGSGAEIEIRTFNHTDNLLYMLLHALKHFISGGFGLRTALDIALYAEKYFDSIDGKRLTEGLENNSAVDFASAIFDICTKELGTDKKIFALIGGRHADGSEMLEDILAAGVYGTSEESRAHSANITRSAANGGSRLSGIVKSIFPPYSYMKKKYSYAEKAPLLLPVAWLHRGIQYLFGQKQGNTASDTLDLARKRAKLIESYGIRLER